MIFYHNRTFISDFIKERIVTFSTIVLFSFVLLFSFYSFVQAQDVDQSLEADDAKISRTQKYITISNVQPRPQALAGAFTAVVDGLSSVIYNPATLQLIDSNKKGGVSVFINPVGIAAGISNSGGFSDSTGTFNGLAATGLFIKSIALSYSAFEVALILTEQLPLTDNANKTAFFNSDGILDAYSDVLATRIKLAEQISLGASLSIHTINAMHQKKHYFGGSYGILIKPNPTFNIGLVYYDIPEFIASTKGKYERFIDETTNLGISWQPHHSTLLSLDIRNVSEENRELSREIHIGTELVPFKHIAIRGGYFKNKNDQKNVFSGGVGLINSSILNRSQQAKYSKDWIVNYSYVYSNSDNLSEIRHYLSILIRLNIL